MAKGKSSEHPMSFCEIIINTKSLGPIIQSRRKTMGFTQEGFAEHLDISVSTIKYLEQGLRAPSVEMLLRVLKGLKLQLKIESK